MNKYILLVTILVAIWAVFSQYAECRRQSRPRHGENATKRRGHAGIAVARKGSRSTGTQRSAMKSPSGASGRSSSTSRWGRWSGSSSGRGRSRSSGRSSHGGKRSRSGGRRRPSSVAGSSSSTRGIPQSIKTRSFLGGTTKPKGGNSTGIKQSPGSKGAIPVGAKHYPSKKEASPGGMKHHPSKKEDSPGGMGKGAEESSKNIKEKVSDRISRMKDLLQKKVINGTSPGELGMRGVEGGLTSMKEKMFDRVTKMKELLKGKKAVQRNHTLVQGEAKNKLMEYLAKSFAQKVKGHSGGWMSGWMGARGTKGGSTSSAGIKVSSKVDGVKRTETSHSEKMKGPPSTKASERKSHGSSTFPGSIKASSSGHHSGGLKGHPGIMGFLSGGWTSHSGTMGSKGGRSYSGNHSGGWIGQSKTTQSKGGRSYSGRSGHSSGARSSSRGSSRGTHRGSSRGGRGRSYGGGRSSSTGKGSNTGGRTGWGGRSGRGRHG